MIIWKEVERQFNRIKSDDSQDKCIQYSGLMTMLEHYYHIPLLNDDKRLQDVNPDVMKLYRNIANERIFPQENER